MNTSVDSTPALIEATYKKMAANIATVKKRLGRALTYGEKILYGHLDNAAEAEIVLQDQLEQLQGQFEDATATHFEKEQKLLAEKEQLDQQVKD